MMGATRAPPFPADDGPILPYFDAKKKGRGCKFLPWHAAAENYQKFDFSTSLDYELSQNLRFTVGGGFTLLNHAYVETEDYTAYNVAANVTVQF